VGTGEGSFGYMISSPVGVFTVELTALFASLRHIGKVIQSSEKCLILTDSLSLVKALLSRKISHRTHPLFTNVNRCVARMTEDGVEVFLKDHFCR
jgi:hypothetical protein